jgi:signal transduction histidine kinase
VASIHSSSPTPAQSIETIDTLLQQANDLLDKPAEATPLLETILYHITRLEADSGQTYPLGLAQCYHLLGETNRRQAKYPEALGFFLQALAYAESDQDPEIALKIYQGLANTYRELGDYTAAIDYALKMVSLGDSANLPVYKVRGLNLCGVVHSYMGEYAGAIAYYDQCLIIHEEMGNESGKASLFNNYSIEYMNLKDYETALRYALESFRLFNRLGAADGQARVQGNLAKIYMHLGDYEKAIHHANAGVMMDRQNNIPFGLMYNLLHMGEILNLAGRYDEALDYLQQALDIAEERQALNVQQQCHQQMTITYKALGDYPTALYHHECFHTIYVRLFNDDSARKINNLKVLHQTEQARQEAEHERQRREEIELYFDRLTKLKDHFINTATHDMKSPLSVAMVYLGLLATHADMPPHLLKYISRIQGAMEKISHLISDMLEIAKLDTGRAIHPETVNIATYLQEFVQGHPEFSEDEKHQLVFEVDQQAGLVEIDRVQFERALENLLSNAIKYSPQGGDIRLSMAQKADQVVICVQDSGLGIPAEDLPHIFEPFYRVQADSHHEIEGSGLGLHITHKIITMHKGNITVTSNPGEGSRFWVSLPVALQSQVSSRLS